MDRDRMGNRRASILATAAVLFGGWACGIADDGKPESKSKAPQIPQRLPMKTLGGMQFWGDVHFFRGWRIQQNVFTKHFRLLDADNYRHAAGSLDECKAALEKIKKEQKLPPMSGKAVILIHGIIRSSKSLDWLHKPLEKDGYTVIRFDYPSTRVTIEESAAHLNSVIRSLKDIEEINFIVHSMGGLVVRASLAKHTDKRIKRMVMVGVPNLGAKMANQFKSLGLFKAIMGPAGQQLISGPDAPVSKLPTPQFEFAIVAGARGTENGFNPLIPGDDDGTVSVASTRLPGAADFMTVPVLHSFLMLSERASNGAMHFIKTGRLREDGEPQPIPKKEKTKVPKPEATSSADKSS